MENKEVKAETGRIEVPPDMDKDTVMNGLSHAIAQGAIEVSQEAGLAPPEAVQVIATAMLTVILSYLPDQATDEDAHNVLSIMHGEQRQWMAQALAQRPKGGV